MNDRLQQVESLFHAALKLNAGERARFLSDACVSDSALREEVESLISAHEEDVGFIDSPATTVVADFHGEPLVGREFGHYKIVSLVGRGGMGEVFLAEDSKLERKVALKLLPAQILNDKTRLHRFVQEAKAASSLNHPNIIVIHDIGSEGDYHYIATELIEGETLRQRLRAARLELLDALNVAIQVASALMTAHEAGIVHRDIKPENIMVRPDGLAKVLDFGLAKVPQRQAPPAGSAAETLARVDTVPGLVMGTAHYMSPEQARGIAVDARTDIFSLGVVIYEMVARRRPFEGETTTDVLASILTAEPRPLTGYSPGTPAELQRIITRALHKDRNERYQTARDLWIDLKNLREEVAFSARLEKSGSPELRSPATTAAPGPQPAVTNNVPAAPTMSARKPGLSPGLIAALILVVMGIVGVKALLSSNATVNVPPPVAIERTLNYWVTVQKSRAGKPNEEPFRLPGEINFEKSYWVRLHFASPQDGHLYIFNEGPPENGEVPPLNVLFPSTTANDGMSLVTGNQTVDIPKKSWFEFDEQQGTEKLWLVWSVNSIPDLEATKEFANDRDRGVILSPGLDRSVRDFLSKARLASTPTVERDEARRETHVKANRDPVVHVLALEHH